MSDNTNGSEKCTVIHEFIGAAASRDGTHTAPCAIITEFIGLGHAVQPPAPNGVKMETSHPSAPPPVP